MIKIGEQLREGTVRRKEPQEVICGARRIQNQNFLFLEFLQLKKLETRFFWFKILTVGY